MIQLRHGSLGILLLLVGAVTATAETQAPPVSPSTSPAPAIVAGQSPTPSQPPPAAEPTAASQQASSAASLEHIKQSLESLPTVRFETQPHYYAKAFSNGVTFMDLVGSFDLKHGAVPYAGMTHQEFLNLVRPKDLYSTTGITPLDMLQAGLVNYTMQRVIQQAYRDIKNARNEDEVRLIRERITLELRALAGDNK